MDGDGGEGRVVRGGWRWRRGEGGEVRMEMEERGDGSNLPAFFTGAFLLSAQSKYLTISPTCSGNRSNRRGPG